MPRYYLQFQGAELEVTTIRMVFKIEITPKNKKNLGVFVCLVTT